MALTKVKIYVTTVFCDLNHNDYIKYVFVQIGHIIGCYLSFAIIFFSFVTLCENYERILCYDVCAVSNNIGSDEADVLLKWFRQQKCAVLDKTALCVHQHDVLKEIQNAVLCGLRKSFWAIDIRAKQMFTLLMMAMLKCFTLMLDISMVSVISKELVYG